jgi:Mg-chelatase subunit ChlI
MAYPPEYSPEYFSKNWSTSFRSRRSRHRLRRKRRPTKRAKKTMAPTIAKVTATVLLFAKKPWAVEVGVVEAVTKGAAAGVGRLEVELELSVEPGAWYV